MIRRERKAAALYTMRTLWQNFGNRPVLIDPRGKHWAPLRDAETLGWTRWSGEHCWLTPAGVEQVVAYGVKAGVMEAAE